MRALAWMARERVAVVNISLVGPQNRLLEQGVAALVKRGHLLVARGLGDVRATIQL